ncbi:hypothetical protein ACE6ED_24760 [Paenibacillus sp. CN-4]|uniref:hypothetical protein n=1 Tax=Paenibacillus nanchangensis TaxID=3348343 RepID=UPI00397D7E86
MGGYDSKGNKINSEGVSLLFHGHPATIIIDAENKQYVTTNPEGKTYESGTPALYIGSLNYKTFIELDVLTCNGGNINYTNNTAITFLENNNIQKVTAWDGELGYTKRGNTYTPRLGGINGHFS